MRFRRATGLRLSKCFYRDAPEDVDLDQSYSGCMRPLIPRMSFCLLIAVFLFEYNDKPIRELLMFFSNAEGRSSVDSPVSLNLVQVLSNHHSHETALS